MIQINTFDLVWVYPWITEPISSERKAALADPRVVELMRFRALKNAFHKPTKGRFELSHRGPTRRKRKALPSLSPVPAVSEIVSIPEPPTPPVPAPVLVTPIISTATPQAERSNKKFEINRFPQQYKPQPFIPKLPPFPPQPFIPIKKFSE